MPQISIIVPVYKVEKYLNRCVDSILNQTFTDFECILVDDGSPDRCPEICDEYAKKDKRIKVIHKQNGGLSDARNAGLDIAQGEYIGFVDSDDWIHPQMYEILYNGIVKNNVLLSVCAFEEVENETSFEKIENTTFKIRNGIDFYVENNVIANIACSKLYHKSLLEDIRFPIGKLHEDDFVTYKLFYKAGKIAYNLEKMYMYFVNTNGITKSEWTVKRLSGLEALEERDKWFIDHKFYQYNRWSKERLLKLYRWNYYKMGNNKDYCGYRKEISRKTRKILLAQRNELDIDFKHDQSYYYIAFPNVMKFYWLFNIFKTKYKEYGMIFCIKKTIKTFFKG